MAESLDDTISISSQTTQPEDTLENKINNLNIIDNTTGKCTNKCTNDCDEKLHSHANNLIKNLALKYIESYKSDILKKYIETSKVSKDDNEREKMIEVFKVNETEKTGITDLDFECIIVLDFENFEKTNKMDILFMPILSIRNFNITLYNNLKDFIEKNKNNNANSIYGLLITSYEPRMQILELDINSLQDTNTTPTNTSHTTPIQPFTNPNAE